jgi:hypothetical protein
VLSFIESATGRPLDFAMQSVSHSMDKTENASIYGCFL